MSVLSSSLLYYLRAADGYSGSMFCEKDGYLVYKHNVTSCAPQYLTILKYLDKRGKCAEKFKNVMPILERIVENKENPDKNDIFIASRITDGYSLRNFVKEIFPEVVGEIDIIKSDMDSSELEKYIDFIKMKFEPNEKLDVIIAYLNYCLDELEDYEYHCNYRKRFEMTDEERAMARNDYNLLMKENDAARNAAARQASRGHII